MLVFVVVDVLKVVMKQKDIVVKPKIFMTNCTEKAKRKKNIIRLWKNKKKDCDKNRYRITILNEAM